METAMVRIRIGGDTTDDIINGSALNPNDNWLIYGRGGADTLTGGNKADLLAGGAGDDTLSGLGGTDVLYGDGGADTLIGGLGQDLLIGGADADKFDFNATNESGNTRRTADVIGDFVAGTDEIDLADIDADTSSGANDAFDFVDAQETNVVENSVTWFQSGGNTFVQLDNNGDTTADMMIVLTGLRNLTEGDFNL
jgi:Ca2+-binding RTX toxin-like protein